MYGEGSRRAAPGRARAAAHRTRAGALRDLHLHDVAGQDVFLAAAHGFEELASVNEQSNARLCARLRKTPPATALRAANAVLERTRGLRAIRVSGGRHRPRGRACRARCPSPRARRRREAACPACRADQALLQRVLLDMADRLVAEVAGEAAAEAQRRRNRRHAGARARRAHELGRSASTLSRQTSAPRARAGARTLRRAPRCARRRRGR